MPNFKEFMKGFDEEPEQPKENRDQIIEKVNQKMMNAGTYGALGDKENYEKSIAEAEELRKGLAPKAEPKPGAEPQPKPNPTEVMKNADAKYKPVYEELDKKGDELYKAYYYEQDPAKKAEYKAQMEENGKKIDALIEEWQKATKPTPKPGSFEKFMQDNEGKPQPLAPEQVKDKMDEEFFDNWKFIYNNLPKSRIAEIAAERTGIPVEQVEAYLGENLKDRPDEEWDADWERSYGPMDLGDWDNVDELKYAFNKADNGGAYGTAENALERLEELGAVEEGTLERYLNGQKIVLK